MVRLHVEFCRYSKWFHGGLFGEGIRDLGDFYVTLFKVQFTFWIKKPYYNKLYAENARKMRELGYEP